MKLIKRLDFGNSSVRADDGFLKIERLFTSCHFCFLTELKNRWHSTTEPSPYRDILFGEKTELRLGLPKGNYIFRFHFYDPREKHAPFDIRICHVEEVTPLYEGVQEAYAAIDIPKGEKAHVDVPFTHEKDSVAVDFIGRDGGFFISGLDIFSEKDVDFHMLFAGLPADELPSTEDVLRNGRNDPKAALFEVTEWIMAHRLPDGFIGDYEMGKRLWYTSSYPLRVLLASYEIFGKEEYYAAAKSIFDRFVSEQLPDGSFTQPYRNNPTAKMTKEEIEKAKNGNWRNLADIGSMTAALAVMCHYAKEPERTTYISAVHKYLGEWAMPYRRENGGFDNGWVHGPAQKVYSVSTASTALTMLIIDSVEGKNTYRKTAEDAISLLCDSWNENGENLNWIFDGTYPGYDHYQNVLEFGDGFYTMEALSAALAISSNQELRAKIFNCLKLYLFGSKGILRFLDTAPWWPVQNIWNNSKSAGNPILLGDFLEYGKELGATNDELERCEKLLSQIEKFLCTPKFSVQIGVMAKDPPAELPFRTHSIQSPSGCAVAATGFAGLSFANMIKPGIIYPLK